MTKLLVALGQQISGTALASVEIINLDDSNPNLICDNYPNLAVAITAPTGQLFAKQLPIICGGIGGPRYCDCYSYGNNKWQSIQSLRECKFGSASVVLSNPNMMADEILLVTGGNTGSVVSTVESFDGEQWNQTMFAQLPTTTTNTYFFEIVQNKWISGKS